MTVTICLAAASWLVMVGSAIAAAMWPQPPLLADAGRHASGEGGSR